MRGCLSILLARSTSCSKEDSAKAEYKEQYVKIAETIAAQIPSNARVSLKLTSPDKNGLPEAFLRKLMAEFSGALVQSSKSRFQILNRNSTEEIWQEAVEFNNQDAAKITKSAGADVSVSLSPKVNEKGIDLSVTAYSLKEESMGIVLASASELIPMNVKAELGVDVQALDKKIDQLSEHINKQVSVQQNEIEKLFIAFADRSSVTQLINTYKTACTKPEDLLTIHKNYFNSKEFKEGCDTFARANCKDGGKGFIEKEFIQPRMSGLKFQCELFNNAENLVDDNIAIDNNISISIKYTNPTQVPYSVTFHNNAGVFSLPDSIEKNSHLIKIVNHPGSMGGSDTKLWNIKLDSKSNFFVSIYHSCASRGCNSEMIFFYDEKYLQKIIEELSIWEELK